MSGWNPIKETKYLGKWLHPISCPDNLRAVHVTTEYENSVTKEIVKVVTVEWSNNKNYLEEVFLGNENTET